VDQHTPKEDQACLESLEDPDSISKELKAREMLCTAMSSYYLLYR
jgi:hypothetical protein